MDHSNGNSSVRWLKPFLTYHRRLNTSLTTVHSHSIFLLDNKQLRVFNIFKNRLSTSRGSLLILHEVLTNYATNTEIKGFVDKYDYYLFPVVNPDGMSPVPVVRRELTSLIQASFTPKPQTDSGERIARPFQQARVLAEISTATGLTSGHSPVEQAPTLAMRHTKVCPLLPILGIVESPAKIPLKVSPLEILQKTKVSWHTSTTSRPEREFRCTGIFTPTPSSS